MLAVNFSALGLAVRADGAADVRALIPGEAQRAERVEDHLLARGYVARAVRILDAQDELAPTLGGVEVVEQSDIRSPNVRVASGRRSDADAGRGRRHASKLTNPKPPARLAVPSGRVLVKTENGLKPLSVLKKTPHEVGASRAGGLLLLYRQARQRLHSHHWVHAHLIRRVPG